MAALAAIQTQNSPSHLRSSAPIAIPVMSTTPPRPGSALARGVQITEYKDSRVNPDPIVLEESDLLLEEYLSPRKLRDLTGVDNLEEVHFLEMKVDTRDTSLGNFGAHLPNLSQLKLSNSIISTVRDLGSCLNSLRVLWMARCGMEDLDGVASMISLRELYLAYNEISDISPCGMLENLQILDLEGNNIDDVSQVEFLALCRSLANLTLEGNPVCVTPSPDQAAPDYDYRATVKRAIPHLRLLDDEPLMELQEDTSSGAAAKPTVSVFEDDWRLIDELMQDGTINVSDDESIEPPGRPQTGSIRPPTSYRPGSALKPYTTATGIRPRSRAGTASGQRPGTGALGRPGSARPGSGVRSGSAGVRPGSGTRPGSAGSGGSRPGSARPGSEEAGEEGVREDASELTTGAVVCGNPGRALKSRLRRPPTTTNTHVQSRLQQMKHKPEHTYDTALEDDVNLSGILKELKDWKSHHRKVVEDIEASKGPQVFVVTHDDAENVSDSQESVSSDDDEDDDDALFRPRRVTEYPERVARFAPDPPAAGTRPKSRSGSAMKRSTPSTRPTLPHDESYDAPEDPITVVIPELASPHPPPSSRKSASVDEIRSPSPVILRQVEETRPNSGPNPPTLANSAKFRLESVVDKSNHANKKIDKANPVIRASIHSPESRNMEGPRAATSRAALGQPAHQLAKIRKGGLANVQLLPSKPPTFTK